MIRESCVSAQESEVWGNRQDNLVRVTSVPSARSDARSVPAPHSHQPSVTPVTTRQTNTNSSILEYSLQLSFTKSLYRQTSTEYRVPLIPTPIRSHQPPLQSTSTRHTFGGTLVHTRSDLRGTKTTIYKPSTPLYAVPKSITTTGVYT